MELHNIIGNIQNKAATKRVLPTTEDIAKYADVMIQSGYRRDEPASFDVLAKFMAYREARLNNRGLILTGNNGTGKTMWLNLFSRCQVRTASEINLVFQRHTDSDAIEIILPPREYNSYPAGYFNLAIDDIGNEPSLNRYGVRTEPISLIIENAYIRWQRGIGIYYASTNLTEPELEARYGKRITSRMAEMFTPVKFMGADHRHKSAF